MKMVINLEHKPVGEKKKKKKRGPLPLSTLITRVINEDSH